MKIGRFEILKIDHAESYHPTGQARCDICDLIADHERLMAENEALKALASPVQISDAEDRFFDEPLPAGTDDPAYNRGGRPSSGTAPNLTE